MPSVLRAMHGWRYTSGGWVGIFERNSLLGGILVSGGRGGGVWLCGGGTRVSRMGRGDGWDEVMDGFGLGVGILGVLGCL